MVEVRLVIVGGEEYVGTDGEEEARDNLGKPAGAAGGAERRIDARRTPRLDPRFRAGDPSLRL